MIVYLLDTNVISELVRAKPNGQVIEWLAKFDRPMLSVISLSEIEFGIHLAAPDKKVGLLTWFDELKATAEFVPVNDPIATIAGRLRAESRRLGYQLSLADGLIAATAVFKKRQLATRNTKDFVATGVPVMNPFSAER